MFYPPPHTTLYMHAKRSDEAKTSCFRIEFASHTLTSYGFATHTHIYSIEQHEC